MPRKLLYLSLLALRGLFAQDNSAASAPSTSPSDWGTRTIQVKYIDPDQLRSVFAGRSFAMQVNRELKVLIVSGPAQFLQEVEQTSKLLDVAPATPANIEVTVYLLATAPASPHSLPTELAAIAKTVSASSGSQALQLVDSETLRVREGQAGDISFGEPAAAGASLTHISLQSASVAAGAKASLISLNGLRCWLSKSSTQASAGSDVTANIDVPQNEAALVAKAGVDKPLIVIVRANVSR